MARFLGIPRKRRFLKSAEHIYIDEARARAKTGGPKGIRGDRRFKGRGYPMETSYHFIHQNICWFSIFREVLQEVATNCSTKIKLTNPR